MRLTVTIEAEHEEASGVPLEGLLVETMGVLTRMGFQAPEYTLELDGPDPSSHTVKELSEDIFPEAPEDASHLTSQEIRGMIVRELRGGDRTGAFEVLKRAHDAADLRVELVRPRISSPGAKRRRGLVAGRATSPGPSASSTCAPNGPPYGCRSTPPARPSRVGPPSAPADRVGSTRRLLQTSGRRRPS